MTFHQKKKKPRYQITLKCEFGDCAEEFADIPEIITHVEGHQADMKTQLDSLAQTMATQPDVDHTQCECPWRECNQALPHFDDWDMCVLHLSLHCYHTFAKARGDEIMSTKNAQTGCKGLPHPVNSLPVPSDKMQCLWQNCRYTSNSCWTFYRHLDDHMIHPTTEDDKWQCLWADCRSMATNRTRLAEHTRSHTLERRYACSTCGNFYSSFSKLNDHHVRQLSEAEVSHQFQCSHCCKKFNNERLLRDHLRRHVNLYGCMLCDMSCPTPSALRTHILYRHSDLKAYKCEHCEKSFKRDYDLARHVELHEAEGMTYSCPFDECEYTSINHYLLLSHIKNHQEGGRLYQCHLCTQEFDEASRISNHLRSVHQLKTPSGHIRFRYSICEDGVYRLVTTRFERKIDSDDEGETEPHTVSDDDQPIVLQTDHSAGQHFTTPQTDHSAGQHFTPSQHNLTEQLEEIDTLEESLHTGHSSSYGTVEGV